MNVRREFLVTAIIGGSLIGASPAQACSFSWNKGYSPSDIQRRYDVETVNGEFALIDAASGEGVRSETINLTQDTGELLGQIQRKGRRPIMTKQHYSEFSVECGAYLAPLGNVSGRFWLERKRDKQGRQRLLMWRPI